MPLIYCRCHICWFEQVLMGFCGNKVYCVLYSILYNTVHVRPFVVSIQRGCTLCVVVASVTIWNFRFSCSIAASEWLFNWMSLKCSASSYSGRNVEAPDDPEVTTVTSTSSGCPISASSWRKRSRPSAMTSTCRRGSPSPKWKWRRMPSSVASPVICTACPERRAPAAWSSPWPWAPRRSSSCAGDTRKNGTPWTTKQSRASRSSLSFTPMRLR